MALLDLADIPEEVGTFEALAVWCFEVLAKKAQARRVKASASGPLVPSCSMAVIEAADGRTFARLEAFPPCDLPTFNSPEVKTWQSAGALVGANPPALEEEEPPPPPPPPPPPTDPLWSSVRLLIPMGGVAGSKTFQDLSSSAHAVASVDPTLSSEQTLFGLNVAKFVPSSGNRIEVPASEQFRVLSSDYCWEAHLWFVDQWSAGIFRTSDSRLALLIDDGRWVLKEITSGDRNTFVTSNNLRPVVNEWVHTCVERVSGVTTLYRGGVAIVSGSSAQVVNTDTSLVFGQGFGRNFSGYMGPVRFTVGSSRYGSNFTPPSAPYLLG